MDLIGGRSRNRQSPEGLLEKGRQGEMVWAWSRVGAAFCGGRRCWKDLRCILEVETC